MPYKPSLRNNDAANQSINGASRQPTCEATPQQLLAPTQRMSQVSII